MKVINMCMCCLKFRKEVLKIFKIPLSPIIQNSPVSKLPSHLLFLCVKCQLHCIYKIWWFSKVRSPQFFRDSSGHLVCRVTIGEQRASKQKISVFQDLLFSFNPFFKKRLNSLYFSCTKPFFM